MLVELSIGVMLIFTLFAILMGSGYTTTLIESDISNHIIQNGSTTTIELASTSFEIGIDPSEGLIGLLVGLAFIIALIGIRILGSGLSEQAVRVISFALIYGGIWALLSALSYGLIVSITYFGSLLYITFTILYVIGVVRKLTSGGD